MVVVVVDGVTDDVAAEAVVVVGVSVVTRRCRVIMIFLLGWVPLT